jgi:hypothetical protein
MYSMNYLKSAHKFAFGNKTSIQSSHLCGCFQCGLIFQPSKIMHWIKETSGTETGWCPYCGMDSLIGDIDHAITANFIQAMKKFWFNDEENIDRSSIKVYESFDSLFKDWVENENLLFSCRADTPKLKLSHTSHD